MANAGKFFFSANDFKLNKSVRLAEVVPQDNADDVIGKKIAGKKALVKLLADEGNSYEHIISHKISDKHKNELSTEHGKDDPIMTTMALGEEGDSRPPADDRPIMTTMALGEEGDLPVSDDRPIMTTMALGEEGELPPVGGDEKDGGIYTTMALGEQGELPPVGGDEKDGGIYTTMALGEQGELPPCPDKKGISVNDVISEPDDLAALIADAFPSAHAVLNTGADTRDLNGYIGGSDNLPIVINNPDVHG